MEENPYKAPHEEIARESRMFLRWPATIIEWVVIVIVAIIAIIVFLPDLDEGRQAARKRLGKQHGFDPGEQRRRIDNYMGERDIKEQLQGFLP